jgi:hypothetical protein
MNEKNKLLNLLMDIGAFAELEKYLGRINIFRILKSVNAEIIKIQINYCNK